MECMGWNRGWICPSCCSQADFRGMGAHTGQQPVLGLLFFFPHAHCNMHFMEKCARRKGWMLADGGEQMLFQTRGGMVDEVVALGEGSSKGQWRLWAAPLIINSIRAPSSSAPAPVSLSLGVSLWELSEEGALRQCWFNNSDPLTGLHLVKIQQSRIMRGGWMSCAPHSVLGRERGQGAPRLPILPGASAASEHIGKAQDKWSKSNPRLMASCSVLPGCSKTNIEEILCWVWEPGWGLQEKIREKVKIVVAFCGDQ